MKIQTHSDRESWLAARATGLGSSDAAAICKAFDGQDDGKTPWKTPYLVWADKMRIGKPLEENERMEWGHRLEPVIRAKFAEIHGDVEWHPHWIVQHPRVPWLLASPDGICNRENAILEIKTSAYGHGFGAPDLDATIPMQYLYQVHHQLLVMEMDRAFLAVLIGGNRYLEFEIRRDEAIINHLVEEETFFWEEYVIKSTPPPPVSVADAKAIWPKSAGTAREITESEHAVIMDWREAKEMAKRADQNKEVMEVATRQIIGEHDMIKFNGAVVATNKADKNGRRMLR